MLTHVLPTEFLIDNYAALTSLTTTTVSGNLYHLTLTLLLSGMTKIKIKERKTSQFHFENKSKTNFHRIVLFKLMSRTETTCRVLRFNLNMRTRRS